MLVLNLPAFENKKCTANDRYGGILAKKEPIRMSRFALPCNKGLYTLNDHSKMTTILVFFCLLAN